MSRLPVSLLALALGLGLAAPLAAQQITTSQGVRTLPRTDGLRSEVEIRSALISSDGIVRDVLADISAIESSRQATVGQATSISDKAKKENAELLAAKATFEQLEKGYLADLAVFQQEQSRIEADVQRQRSEAAVLQALPSAQRDYAQVERLNKWAEQLASQRTALDADRNRLLADHAKVESERARLAKLRADTESRLTGMRDATIGQYGSVEQKRAAAYAQLKTALAHLRKTREQLRAVATMRLEDSPTLEQGSAKLRQYEASPTADGR